MIHVEGLKKYYGTTRGIECVDLTVNQGEIFGFVGPNGSGKTTLIRILLGLITADQGVAKLFNQDVKIGQYKLNEEIGYMPSESYFYNELKVIELFNFFKSVRQVSDDYLNMLIQELDIDVSKKFKALSFGNKKKIGIVFALMHQPRLLILDEPTSGLDPLIQSRFLSILNQQKQKGTTIFLSSHVLSEIERVCDRVALIKDGNILFTKTMEDIKKDEHKRLIVSPSQQQLKLDGLNYIKDQNDSSYYSYQGDINLLTSYLSKHTFKDLHIKDVGLEEIFSIYYEKEEL